MVLIVALGKVAVLSIRRIAICYATLVSLRLLVPFSCECQLTPVVRDVLPIRPVQNMQTEETLGMNYLMPCIAVTLNTASCQHGAWKVANVDSFHRVEMHHAYWHHYRRGR